MISRQILETALRRSGAELGCGAIDFLCAHFITVPSPDCRFLSYGGNIVAAIPPQLRSDIENFLSLHPGKTAFDLPNLLALERILESHGFLLGQMEQFFLPETGCQKELSGSVRPLSSQETAALDPNMWSRALTAPDQPETVCGAFEGETLTGIAAAYRDCKTMQRIRAEVLPAYRMQRTGTALVNFAAQEIFSRGFVPFCGISGADLPAVRCLLNAGFRPAWTELHTENLSGQF